MKQTVKIGDQEVEMLATAASDIYFYELFHEDPIKITMEGNAEGGVYKMMHKMGFVMAMQAVKERKEMIKLTFEDYVKWADQFDRSDYAEAIAEIRLVYERQKDGESEPKKEEDQ